MGGVETRVHFTDPVDPVWKDGMARLRRKILCVAVASLILFGCSQSPQAREARYLEKGKREFQRKNYAVASPPLQKRRPGATARR